MVSTGARNFHMHMSVELCPEQLTRDRDRALLGARPWTSRGRGLSYAGLGRGCDGPLSFGG